MSSTGISWFRWLALQQQQQTNASIAHEQQRSGQRQRMERSLGRRERDAPVTSPPPGPCQRPDLGPKLGSCLISDQAW
ncbi:unnamed protein product [Sphagnum troendelagicum]|uniref:Uncharacterized protein n=1 Tax=Sphagnum troendelagicum TaxID=128251 RepID=A0ABP0V6D1_9BRYO